MGQIESAGVITQPVSVWMDANGKVHVIDGFHRSEAARRLGLSTIKVHLIDCDEKHFWDLRISATTEHKAVANDRLHMWMLDAWNLTDWAKANQSSFAETAYNVYFILYHRLKKPSLSRDEKPLLDWFGERAKIWGKDAREIARIILDKSGLFVHYTDLLEKAMRQELTYQQYVSTVRAVDVQSKAEGVSGKDLQKLVEAGAKSPEGVTGTLKDIVASESKTIQPQNESPTKKATDQVLKLKSVITVVGAIVDSGVIVSDAMKAKSGLDNDIVQIVNAMNLFVEWVSDDYKWNIVAVREENARLKHEISELKDKVSRGPVIVPSSVLAQSSSDYRY
jgi:hypothetical protein